MTGSERDPEARRERIIENMNRLNGLRLPYVEPQSRTPEEVAEALAAIAKAGPTMKQAAQGMRAFADSMQKLGETMKVSLARVGKALAIASHHRTFVVTVRTPTGTEGRRIYQRVGGWSL